VSQIAEWEVCGMHPEYCLSGQCSGLTGLCYNPGSKKTGNACILTGPNQPSHCQDGYVCVGTCIPKMSWGAVGCSKNEQCPAGMVCRGGAGNKQKACLFPLLDRNLGESCIAPTECVSAVCMQGKCTCSPAYCAGLSGTNYCADNGLCYPRQADGQDCCSPDQCIGGACTKLLCTAPVYSKTGVAGGGMDKGFTSSCNAAEECQSGYCIQGQFSKNCGCSSNSNCSMGKKCVNGVCKY